MGGALVSARMAFDQRARSAVEQSGLDCYIQAQIKFCAASDQKDIALWSEVWSYIQTSEGAGWNDWLFVVIEPDGEALEEGAS